jgi:hypothetical protein
MARLERACIRVAAKLEGAKTQGAAG